jgi:hypothetical protein
MYTYTAHVRIYVSGVARMIKTQVQAQSSYDAQLLLKQQYGNGNLMSLPQKA